MTGTRKYGAPFGLQNNERLPPTLRGRQSQVIAMK